ncbi:MAG: DUF115 domain-containing protein [Desulfovibrio sp.]|nr:MAG: DUF115 domain-containing protein [Desulfovibrio sp.]
MERSPPQANPPTKPRVLTCSGLPENLNGELVIRLGQVTTSLPRPQGPSLDLPTPSRSDEPLIQRIDPKVMAHGVCFQLDKSDPSLDPEQVFALQKQLLHRYYKHAYFPSYSPATSDPHGMRQTTSPELVREVNKMKNIPFILRYPLAEKLSRLQARVPALLLLPGPSLGEVLPHLPELAKRYAVIAVSRTLKACLENGVEPDVVVQLDTFLQQQRFYSDTPRLEQTILVPLSVAAIHTYAAKFRGVLFMDSFNQHFLPNPWRLRENYVSTLMACMGMAECFHAPKALVAGVDLAMTGGKAYQNSQGEGHSQDAPRFLQADNGVLHMADRLGNHTTTQLRYLATAVEAENYARDIGAATNTRFHTLSNSGILDPVLFPHMDMAQALDSPLLDREALLQAMDQAMAEPEDVRLYKLKVECTKSVAALALNDVFLRSCQANKSREGLDTNPVWGFAAKERDFHLPDDHDLRLGFSIRMNQLWSESLASARNHVTARLMAQRGTPVPLVCLPDEMETLPQALADLFHGFAWRIMPMFDVAMDPASRTTESIPAGMLHPTLNDLDLSFVSTKAAEEYAYQFQVYGKDNLVFLRELGVGE